MSYNPQCECAACNVKRWQQEEALKQKIPQEVIDRLKEQLAKPTDGDSK